MRVNEATRFFDTSGCLNLSRPTSGIATGTTPVKKQRSSRASLPRRGQLKIDLYNFDHVDFIDSKYVLTSPRSLEACSRLNIKVKENESSQILDLVVVLAGEFVTETFS